MSDQENDTNKMGGVEWEGEPAGTSGSSAPGTEAGTESRHQGGPSGERPSRRGHEDVGDESGEPGFVGDPATAGLGEADDEEE